MGTIVGPRADPRRLCGAASTTPGRHAKVLMGRHLARRPRPTTRATGRQGTRWDSRHLPAIRASTRDRVVFASRRTIDTLDSIGAAIPEHARVVLADELYGATRELAAGLLRGVDDGIDSTIVVGHNPTVQDLALLLVGEAISDIRARLSPNSPRRRRHHVLRRRLVHLLDGVAALDDLYVPRPPRRDHPRPWSSRSSSLGAPEHRVDDAATAGRRAPGAARPRRSLDEQAPDRRSRVSGRFASLIQKGARPVARRHGVAEAVTSGWSRRRRSVDSGGDSLGHFDVVRLAQVASAIRAVRARSCDPRPRARPGARRHGAPAAALAWRRPLLWRSPSIERLCPSIHPTHGASRTASARRSEGSTRVRLPVALQHSVAVA